MAYDFFSLLNPINVLDIAIVAILFVVYINKNALPIWQEHFS